MTGEEDKVVSRQYAVPVKMEKQMKAWQKKKKRGKHRFKLRKIWSGKEKKEEQPIAKLCEEQEQLQFRPKSHVSLLFIYVGVVVESKEGKRGGRENKKKHVQLKK